MQEHKFDRAWRTHAGPWDAEPDMRVWTDESTGMPCLIMRMPELGHLCGYVGVRANHPWFNKHYESIDADVHGGLTYASVREDEAVWWLGFDCAHAGDALPYRVNDYHSNTYRTIGYVAAECEKLAMQAYFQK